MTECPLYERVDAKTVPTVRRGKGTGQHEEGEGKSLSTSGSLIKKWATRRIKCKRRKVLRSRTFVIDSRLVVWPRHRLHGIQSVIYI